MKGSSLSLETQRKNMFKVFKQKCGGLNMPRLAAMGFGPSCGQLAKCRDYFQASQNVQPEKKWAPFYFWMYRHGEDLPCTGKSGKNSEPFLEECVIHAILDCVMRDVLVKFAQLFLYW